MDDEARAQYEGFRPGLYIRVQVNGMPCEFVDHFDPTYPVILGGLLPSEQNIGYVNVSFLPIHYCCCFRVGSCMM